MTQIGIVRKVDSLGRMTLPMKFRRVFQIGANDRVEILATDEGILLRIPHIEVRRIGVSKGGERQDGKSL